MSARKISENSEIYNNAKDQGFITGNAALDYSAKNGQNKSNPSFLAAQFGKKKIMNDFGSKERSQRDTIAWLNGEWL